MSVATSTRSTPTAASTSTTDQHQIVLVLRPEALMGPGFQMSFAATTALVAVFGWLRDIDRNWLPRWAKPVFATVVSSAVAGFATAPIAAAHFNAIAHYGLIANLAAYRLVHIEWRFTDPAVLAAAVTRGRLRWLYRFHEGGMDQFLNSLPARWLKQHLPCAGTNRCQESVRA